MPPRLVARLLELAVRRWPEQQREDLAREWAAEVHELGHEAGVAVPLRVWRQLRFAASLALARPSSVDAAVPYWLRHVGWLLVAPFLAMLAIPVVQTPLLLPFGWITIKPTLSVVFALESYAAAMVVSSVMGTLLARRLRRRRLGQPTSLAVAASATLALIGGMLIVDGLARAGGHVSVGGWFDVIAALCLATVLPPAAAGVAALSARGRRWPAMVLAWLGAPVLTLAVLYVLVLLARQVPAEASTQPWWWLTYLRSESLVSIGYSAVPGTLAIQTVLPVLSGLVLTTVVLALSHAIRLTKPLPSTLPIVAANASQPRDTVDIPAVVRSPWWPRVALAGAAYAVLAWAVTLTYLTPNIGVQNSWPSRTGPDGQILDAIPAGWPDWTTEEGRLWMHELQLSGIVCAALCLLCAAAYRGRPLLPTLAGSGVLLAVNMAVVREGWATPRLLPYLAVAGLVLGAAVWWASIRRPPRRSAQSRPRRLLITITVLAAFLVPGSFMPRAYVVAGVQAPPVVLLVVLGLPTILTVIAAMGVLATSNRPARGPAWRLPAALASLPAIGGVLYFQDGLIPTNPEEGFQYQYLLLMGPPLLAVPVAAWTIFAIRAREPFPQRLRLPILVSPLLFIAGFALVLPTILASAVIAGLVLFPMEYGQTFDGLAYEPGAVFLGLLLGYFSATRLSPITPDRTTRIDMTGQAPAR